jgi:hypothetical protein
MFLFCWGNPCSYQDELKECFPMLTTSITFGQTPAAAQVRKPQPAPVFGYAATVADQFTLRFAGSFTPSAEQTALLEKLGIDPAEVQDRFDFQTAVLDGITRQAAKTYVDFLSPIQRNRLQKLLAAENNETLTQEYYLGEKAYSALTYEEGKADGLNLSEAEREVLTFILLPITNAALQAQADQFDESAGNSLTNKMEANFTQYVEKLASLIGMDPKALEDELDALTEGNMVVAALREVVAAQP